MRAPEKGRWEGVRRDIEASILAEFAVLGSPAARVLEAGTVASQAMNDAPRERVLTGPLLAFLALVAGVMAWAVASRLPAPDLEGAVELLADGDLDGDERERMLLRILELDPAPGTLRGRWAQVLAAVALEDRPAFAALEPALGAGPARVLLPTDRQWLDLGDPLLANVLEAMSHEAAGDRAAARRVWAQVGAQARMTHQTFAGELAEAARTRLE